MTPIWFWKFLYILGYSGPRCAEPELWNPSHGAMTIAFLHLSRPRACERAGADFRYIYSLNSFSYARQEVTELVSSYIHAVITRHNRQTQTAVHFYLLHLGMGAFNNYPWMDNFGHFTWYVPFVHVNKCGLSTDHLPTSSCPHGYWMPQICRVYRRIASLTHFADQITCDGKIKL